MNIQIFGKSKCFETKKAERYFKERKISYQLIQIEKYGMSKGEFTNVKNALGGIESLLNTEHKDYASIQYLAYDSDKEEKLLENPRLFKTPIVRNAKKATVGYCPEIWETWE